MEGRGIERLRVEGAGTGRGPREGVSSRCRLDSGLGLGFITTDGGTLSVVRMSRVSREKKCFYSPVPAEEVLNARNRLTSGTAPRHAVPAVISSVVRQC